MTTQVNSGQPVQPLILTPNNEAMALNIIATDFNFALKWRNCLYPEHFNNPHNQMVFRAIKSYYLSYGKLPVFTSMEQLIKAQCTIDDPVGDIIAHCMLVLGSKAEDPEFIKLLLLDHIKNQDYENFVVACATHVRDRKFDEIPKLVGDLLGRHRFNVIVNEYGHEQGTPLEHDTVVARVERETRLKPALGTKYPTFNGLHGGGYEPGGVYVFMGPSGSGKSILLVNDGCHFLAQGKVVYHFTFELSAEKTKARYDVCLSGCNHETRKTNPGALDTRIKDINAKAKSVTGREGKLYVIEYPTGTCDAHQIAGSIEEHRLITGFSPDVIILDYLTIMRPTDAKSVDMKSNYDKQKVIAEEVRALAMTLNIPIITAVQSNRGSMSKDVIHKDDIADSWGVIHVVDGVLSINQQDVEKQAATLRLYMAKSRNHTDGFTIVCKVDYGTLQITESPLETSAYNSGADKLKKDKADMYARAVANPTTGAPMVVPIALDPSSPDANVLAMKAFNDMQNMGQRMSASSASNLPPPPPTPVITAPIAPPPPTPLTQ